MISECLITNQLNFLKPVRLRQIEDKYSQMHVLDILAEFDILLVTVSAA